MDKYLPVGTVVLLKNANKRLMIYGRRQIHGATRTEYDYVGVLFPEGYLDDEHTYLFNHDQIDSIFQMGYVDPTEIEYCKSVLKKG